MAWTPLTPQSMPADGERVLVTNGAEVTHWQTLPELPGA